MGVLVGAAGCGLNVALYLDSGHHWWNAAPAVFCGLIAIACAIDGVA